MPEGTAAKKLQAHQHIDPLDPRLLNPAIPDGLAAILSGMMAKNPDQRFQTPTDLIAHLKGLMEQLKLNPESISKDAVIQGVPANPSVIPEPPRLRLSLLLAACRGSTGDCRFCNVHGGFRFLSPPNRRGSRIPSGGVGLVLNRLRRSATSRNQPTKASTIRNVKQLVEVLSSPNAGQRVQLKLGAGKFDFTDYKEGISITR